MKIDIHTHISRHPEDTRSIVNWRWGKPEPEHEEYSVGVHPWDADRDVDWTKFREAAANAVAIGECGIDKLRPVDMQKQIEVFEKQIEIAEKIGKSVIVHCVKCFGKLMEIRRRMMCRQTWIIHGCYASTEWIREAEKEGMYFSIGPAQLDMKRGPEMAKSIDINRLLTETDERQESIEETYKRIEEIRGEEIEEFVWNNAIAALRKKE